MIWIAGKCFQTSNFQQKLGMILTRNYNVLCDTPGSQIIWVDTWGIVIKVVLIRQSLGRYKVPSNTVTNLPVNSCCAVEQLGFQVYVSMAKAHYLTRQCSNYTKSTSSSDIHTLSTRDQSTFLASFSRILVMSYFLRIDIKLPKYFHSNIISTA